MYNVVYLLDDLQNFQTIFCEPPISKNLIKEIPISSPIDFVVMEPVTRLIPRDQCWAMNMNLGDKEYFELSYT